MPSVAGEVSFARDRVPQARDWRDPKVAIDRYRTELERCVLCAGARRSSATWPRYPDGPQKRCDAAKLPLLGSWLAGTIPERPEATGRPIWRESGAAPGTGGNLWRGSPMRRLRRQAQPGITTSPGWSTTVARSRWQQAIDSAECQTAVREGVIGGPLRSKVWSILAMHGDRRWSISACWRSSPGALWEGGLKDEGHGGMQRVGGRETGFFYAVSLG